MTNRTPQSATADRRAFEWMTEALEIAAQEVIVRLTRDGLTVAEARQHPDYQVTVNGRAMASILNVLATGWTGSPEVNVRYFR